MKRLALVPCLIAMLLVPGTARAELPALAGHNVVVGKGPTAVLVQLQKDVSIDYHHPESWLDSFKTTGSYAAVGIQEAKPGGQFLGFMRLFPSGCNKARNCQPVTKGWAHVQATKEGELPEVMNLNKGKYWIYVLTDPGAHVEAKFPISDLEGSSRLAAHTPVTAQLKSEVVTCLGVCQHQGRITGQLHGEGIVAAGQWQSRFPTEPYLEAKHHFISCFHEGRGADDPYNACTDSEFRSIGGNPNLYARKGTWTFAYRKLEATELSGLMGSYALFLTFPK